MTNKDILQRWYDEIWGKGNLDVIEELLCPDTLANGIFTAFSIRAEEFGELIQAGRTLLSDITTEIALCIEQDNRLAARLVFRAERADTGEPITFTSQVMVEFRDGKIVQMLNQLDYFTLFEQLGQIPREALAVCLTGQRLIWE